MAKNKRNSDSFASIFKPQSNMTAGQNNRNQIRKNNMNYTNINKNRGK